MQWKKTSCVRLPDIWNGVECVSVSQWRWPLLTFLCWILAVWWRLSWADCEFEKALLILFAFALNCLMGWTRSLLSTAVAQYCGRAESCAWAGVTRLEIVGGNGGKAPRTQIFERDLSASRLCRRPNTWPVTSQQTVIVLTAAVRTLACRAEIYHRFPYQSSHSNIHFNSLNSTRRTQLWPTIWTLGSWVRVSLDAWWRASFCLLCSPLHGFVQSFDICSGPRRLATVRRQSDDQRAERRPLEAKVRHTRLELWTESGKWRLWRRVHSLELLGVVTERPWGGQNREARVCVERNGVGGVRVSSPLQAQEAFTSAKVELWDAVAS